MNVYNFHLFDGKGNCLFSLNPDETKGSAQDRVKSSSESTRLLYGFLYSLKSFCQRINPEGVKDVDFMTYTTTAYQLFFMELPTSLKMVLIVQPDPSKSNEYYKSILTQFHRQIYLEFVVMNPLELRPSDPSIKSTLFREHLIQFFNSVG